MFYSGGVPEFFEADVFKQVLPITEKGDNTPVNTPVSRENSILIFCATPKTKAEIVLHIGFTDLKPLQRAYLSPMVKKGLLQLTNPDKSTCRNQKYVAEK